MVRTCPTTARSTWGYDFTDDGIKGLTLRFDVINVFDQIYQIRNGTGVGVGAPQYGPRRGFYGGMAWAF
jgi:outer membrane receptor protein involved in Fe transport